MVIKLYGFKLSPPYRSVLLTARAIGVELHEEHVDLQKNEHMTEQFLKMNPTHTVPTLDDDGFHIWESRCIMGYLVQQYATDDALYPKEPRKRALVDNMLYFDAACLYSTLFQFLRPFLFNGKAPDPDVRALVIERMGFLDTILSDRKYASGDRLTIADLGLVTSVSACEEAQFTLDEFPNIVEWSARVKRELPYFEEVNAEGAQSFKNFVASKMPK